MSGGRVEILGIAKVLNYYYNIDSGMVEVDTGSSGAASGSVDLTPLSDNVDIEIKDQLVHDCAAVAIEGSGGAFVTLIASAAGLAEITQIQTIDGTNTIIGIYKGSSGNEVLVAVISAGKHLVFPCQIPASTRISARGLEAANTSANKFTCLFLGPQ